MHKLALSFFCTALVACGSVGTVDDAGSGPDTAPADASRDVAPTPDVSAVDSSTPDAPAVARCGDGVVAATEQCDDGPANAAGAPCNERCRFPERVVNTTATGAASRPALAWGMGQPLVAGFEAGTGVFVHFFDASGDPRVSTRNDVGLGSVGTTPQNGVALASTANGFATGWVSSGDLRGAIVSGFDLTAPPTSFSASPITHADLHRAATPRVAVGNVGTLWVFQDRDVTYGPLRSAGTRTAEPTPPIAEGGVFGASYASEPQLVAVGDDFIAVWTTTMGTDRDVMASLMVHSGSQGPPVRIAAGGGDQIHPALATRGDDVVVAWQEGAAIRWQLFDARLAPVGALVTVPASEGTPVVSPPTVAIDDHRNALIAWASDSDGVVRGQFYRLADRSPAPNPFDGTTGAFEIDAPAGESGHTAGPRINPVAAFGGTGRFAVAWEDLSTANSAIHMRVLRGP